MPKFYFQRLDGTGQDAVESELEFDSFGVARSEAESSSVRWRERDCQKIRPAKIPTLK